MERAELYAEIEAERQRQDAKHGPVHRDRQMPVILMEEVGEAARAVLEDDPARLREELVQVAAVAVQWIEQVDRWG